MAQHLTAGSVFVMLNTILKAKHITLRNYILRKRRETFSNLQLNLCRMNNNYYRQLVNQISGIVHLVEKPRLRSLWKKERSNDFWVRIVLLEFSDSDWIDNFRMSRSTFFKLVDELRSELKSKDNFVRQPISTEKKVAITIYKLASCCEYRVVANQFGVHKSTVHKCVYSVVTAINKILLPKTITIPNQHEANEIANAVCTKTGLVQIFGFIDGTHIPILPPEKGYRDFINRKGWPSLILQGVVDHKYRCRDIAVTHPGSCHDAVVFKNSGLYQRSNRIIPKDPKMIDGKLVPLMLIGDPAYPLLPWLLKGYTGSVTPEEESFNTYLSSARIAVENAFGRLKGRWRCLCKRIDINYKFVPQIISACCVLHNFVEENKEEFKNGWMSVVTQAETCYPQPTARTVNNIEDAREVRDHLMRYMAKNFPLKKSSLRRN